MWLTLKELSRRGGCGAGKKGKLKNEGISHDVIENKCRKISVLGYPTMSMKTKGLLDHTHDVYEKKCT